MPTKSGRKALSDYPCYATVQMLREHFGAIEDLDERESAMQDWEDVLHSERFAAKVLKARAAATAVHPIPHAPCQKQTCKTRKLKLKGANWEAHPPTFLPGWDGPCCPTKSCRIEHFTRTLIRCQCVECEPRGLVYTRQAGGTNIRTKLSASRIGESPGPSRVSHFHYECCITVGRADNPQPRGHASAATKAAKRRGKKRKGASIAEASAASEVATRRAKEESATKKRREEESASQAEVAAKHAEWASITMLSQSELAGMQLTNAHIQHKTASIAGGGYTPHFSPTQPKLESTSPTGPLGSEEVFNDRIAHFASGGLEALPCASGGGSSGSSAAATAATTLMAGPGGLIGGGSSSSSGGGASSSSASACSSCASSASSASSVAATTSATGPGGLRALSEWPARLLEEGMRSESPPPPGPEWGQGSPGKRIDDALFSGLRDAGGASCAAGASGSDAMGSGAIGGSDTDAAAMEASQISPPKTDALVRRTSSLRGATDREMPTTIEMLPPSSLRKSST
jgi:hypothetical protein